MQRTGWDGVLNFASRRAPAADRPYVIPPMSIEPGTRLRVEPSGVNAWEQLNRRIVNCNACPRLREHCSAVAVEKRAAFREHVYWGRPVPNLGDPSGRFLVDPADRGALWEALDADAAR